MIIAKDKKGVQVYTMEGILLSDREYTDMEAFGENGLALVKVKKLCGYVDRMMHVVIPAEYDELTAFSNGYCRCRTKKLWGAYDMEGNLAVEPAWDSLSYFNEEHIGVAVKKKKAGLIDANGNVLLEPCMDEISPHVYDGGLMICRKGKKEGVVNIEGEIVCEPGYDSISLSWMSGISSVEKVRKVYLGGYTGALDQNGRLALPPIYKWIEYGDEMQDRLLARAEGGTWGLFYADGQPVVMYDTDKGISLTGWDSIGNFDAVGRAVVQIGSYYGLIDKQGNIVLELQPYKLYYFNGYGYRKASMDDRYLYVDEDGNPVIKIVSSGSGLINDPSSLLSSVITIAYGFSPKGKAFVRIGNLYGMIDLNGNIVVEPCWSLIYDVKTPDGTIYIVETAGEYQTGTRINVITGEESTYMYMESGKRGIVDRDGNCIADAVYDRIVTDDGACYEDGTVRGYIGSTWVDIPVTKAARVAAEP